MSFVVLTNVRIAFNETERYLYLTVLFNAKGPVYKYLFITVKY